MLGWQSYILAVRPPADRRSLLRQYNTSCNAEFIWLAAVSLLITGGAFILIPGRWAASGTLGMVTLKP